jgi:hypothetical protein
MSVSLSDELKARTDAYARQHSLGVSDIVQAALEQYLKSNDPVEPPTTPPPSQPLPPPVFGGPDQQLRNYVQDLVLQVELMRRSMQGAMLPVPYPLPAPPWYQPWTTGETWPPATQLKLLPPPEG